MLYDSERSLLYGALLSGKCYNTNITESHGVVVGISFVMSPVRTYTTTSVAFIEVSLAFLKIFRRVYV